MENDAATAPTVGSDVCFEYARYQTTDEMPQNTQSTPFSRAGWILFLSSATAAERTRETGLLTVMLAALLAAVAGALIIPLNSTGYIPWFIAGAGALVAVLYLILFLMAQRTIAHLERISSDIFSGALHTPEDIAAAYEKIGNRPS